MAVPRVKHNKSKIHRPAESPMQIVKAANKVTLSITCMTLAKVLELPEEKIGEFLAGYVAMLEEISDGRNTPGQMIIDCDEMLGYNISEIIDELFSKGKK